MTRQRAIRTLGLVWIIAVNVGALLGLVRWAADAVSLVLVGLLLTASMLWAYVLGRQHQSADDLHLLQRADTALATMVATMQNWTDGSKKRTDETETITFVVADNKVVGIRPSMSLN